MNEVIEDVDMLADVRERYPNGFFLEVAGDSMNHIILDGGCASLDPDKAPRNGDVVAVNVNGYDATLKRYSKSGGKVTLLPDSINLEHEPLVPESEYAVQWFGCNIRLSLGIRSLLMKIGVRKPSIKRSVKARTTGRAKRAVKRAINPTYGKKGMGAIKSPKRAAKNAVYSRVTIGVPRPDSKSSRSAKKEYASNSSSRIRRGTEVATSKTKQPAENQTQEIPTWVMLIILVVALIVALWLFHWLLGLILWIPLWFLLCVLYILVFKRTKSADTK